MHSVKAGLKDALSPQVMFTDLGLKYMGPIDGHDEHAVRPRCATRAASMRR
jgi:1-deoxy-D-xylulose-5-phosphate synthase